MPAETLEQDEKLSKGFEVVINGTETSVNHHTLTYEEIGQLAYPNHDPQALFTITYRNADTSRGGIKNGVLVAGESVNVKKNGTSFDVRLTTRS